MTMPRDMSFPERFDWMEKRIAALELLTIGRPTTDPSAGWTPFTPSFLSGVTSIGNGTAQGYYKVAEGKVTFDLEIVVGSTSTFTGAEIQVDIPATVITDTTLGSAVGIAVLTDASAFAVAGVRSGACVLGYLPEIIYAIDISGAFRFYFGSPAAGMTSASPITLATSDSLKAQVTVPGTLAG